LGGALTLFVLWLQRWWQLADLRRTERKTLRAKPIQRIRDSLDALSEVNTYMNLWIKLGAESLIGADIDQEFNNATHRSFKSISRAYIAVTQLDDRQLSSLFGTLMDLLGSYSVPKEPGFESEPALDHVERVGDILAKIASRLDGLEQQT